ncbi:hypothetical protein Bca4012_083888 [Brassica carinata]
MANVDQTERDTQKMTEADIQQVKGSGEIRLNIDESKEKTERDTQKMTEADMQQVKGSGEIRLNIDESDSIEAAVYDLEELIVRIQWIKKMLRGV